MTNDALLEYVEALRTAPETARLPEEIEGALPDALRLLGRDLNEAFLLALSLSNGDLQQEATSRNILAGPLKDLQASLRHLTWQAEQIEKGDYQQRTAFLGDFSRVFNRMVAQLARREDILRAQLTQQAEYYDALTEVYGNWRACRHDLANHLFCIDSLLAAEDAQGARAYIQNLLQKAEQKDRDFIYTENRVLDALLMDKLRIARKAGIQVEQAIAVNRKLALDPVDCCVLFGNALDNAIEACRRMERGEKRLILELKLTGNVLHMQLENTTDRPPVQDGAFFQSAKPDGGQHGFGLRNMQKVIEAYEGVWNVDCSNGWFRFRSLLCGV